MRDRKLAIRYARALLETLPDEREARSAEAFLSALAEVIGRSQELRDVLQNPAVPRSSRKALLVQLAVAHDAPRQVRNFLGVVVDHGRAGDLAAMSEAFREAREEAAGIVPVILETAAPLSAGLVDRARAVLEKLTGHKVRLRVDVRSAHIGGAVAHIGSRVYDGSLRNQLAMLRRRMAME
jgi:F-type H+-transporting ATPase subunit delta